MKVTLPLEMYNIMVQQVKIHNHLMWSDKLWNDAESHAPQECKGVVVFQILESLNSVS